MIFRTMLFLALLSQPILAATHEAGMGTWVSVPRGAISIVVDEKGARIIGPGWEREFAVTSDKPVKINLDEKSWFVLRLRQDGVWEGTYYHPAVRPEEDGEFKRHLMLLKAPLNVQASER